MIFPEGTRHDGQSLASFKKGAFEIAIKAGVQIQPVIIQNYYFIDHDKKVFGRGQLKVKIMPAMESRGETAEEWSRRVSELMNSEYQKMMIFPQ